MALSVMEYCQHSPSTPSSAHNSAAITPAPTPTAIFHCPADAVGAAPVDCDVVGDVVTPERDCPASEVVVAVVCDGGGTVSVWVIALDAPPAVLLLSEIGGTVSVCVDTLDALLVSEIGGMEKALEVVETGGPDALTGVVLVTITVELSERGTVSDEMVMLDAVLGGTESTIDEVLKLDVSLAACGAAAARPLASTIVHERAVVQRMFRGREVKYYSD